MLKKLKHLIFFLLSLSLIGIQLTLTACANNEHESVKEYVNTVKSIKASKIEGIPEVGVYASVDYKASDLKSPFEEKLYIAEESLESQLQLRPDAKRVRELLEKFPLESFTMVGTLSKTSEVWGLIVDINGAIHKVRVGNYIGENSGKIYKITKDKIYIRETISDSVGGWVPRLTSIGMDNK